MSPMIFCSTQTLRCEPTDTEPHRSYARLNSTTSISRRSLNHTPVSSGTGVYSRPLAYLARERISARTSSNSRVERTLHFLPLAPSIGHPTTN